MTKIVIFIRYKNKAYIYLMEEGFKRLIYTAIFAICTSIGVIILFSNIFKP